MPAFRSALLPGLAGALLLCTFGCAKEDPTVVDPYADVDPESIEVNPDDWEVFQFDELELPYEDSDACLVFQDEENGNTSDEVMCLCDGCLELMQECDALPGCIEIRACILESGCTDANSCYLVPFVAPCTDVIDKYGNSSVATAISTALMDCATENACR